MFTMFVTAPVCAIAAWFFYSIYLHNQALGPTWIFFTPAISLLLISLGLFGNGLALLAEYREKKTALYTESNLPPGRWRVIERTAAYSLAIQHEEDETCVALPATKVMFDAAPLQSIVVVGADGSVLLPGGVVDDPECVRQTLA